MTNNAYPLPHPRRPGLAPSDSFEERAQQNMEALSIGLGQALGNLRIVRGIVGATGTIVVGTGFSVTKNGTGDYTITFDSAFSGIPAVVAMAGPQVAPLAVKQNTTTISGAAVRLLVFNTATAASADADFHFHAIG